MVFIGILNQFGSTVHLSILYLDPARTFICMECGDIHFIEHNVCIAHIFGVAFKYYTISEKSALDQFHSAAAFDCTESLMVWLH